MGRYEAMLQFFADDDWAVEEIDGSMSVGTMVQGDNGRWGCTAHMLDDIGLFVFYSICPIDADADRRPAVTEFVTRANYGLLLGNFETDLDSGDIRFKTTADLSEVPVDDAGGTFAEQLRSLIYLNVTTFDRYLPGLMAVLAAEQTAAEALADVGADPVA